VEQKFYWMAGDAKEQKSKVNYQTGCGFHSFTYKGHIIWVSQMEG